MPNNPCISCNKELIPELGDVFWNGIDGDICWSCAERLYWGDQNSRQDDEIIRMMDIEEEAFEKLKEWRAKNVGTESRPKIQSSV